MTDLEPLELADIHNHLVPGVDDGARTLEESIRNLRALRADGVTELATSSHLNGWLVQDGTFEARLHRLEVAFEQLRAACADRDDVPRLRFNQEILTPTADIAGRVLEHPRVGLRDTRYVLCEFGFDPAANPLAIVEAALATGRRMIVAHPERYRQNGHPMPMAQIRAWKDAGALLQVNCGSLLGDYGPGCQSLGWQIVAEGLADLLASDNHADHRPISPRAAARALVARGATEQARLLLAGNPGRILADEEPLPVPALGTEAAA